MTAFIDSKCPHGININYPQTCTFCDDKPCLRDQFAMAALTGILANPGCNPAGHWNADRANDAYQFADTMLAARENQK